MLGHPVSLEYVEIYVIKLNRVPFANPIAKIPTTLNINFSPCCRTGSHRVRRGAADAAPVAGAGEEDARDAVVDGADRGQGSLEYYKPTFD